MKYKFDGYNWLVRLEKGEKLVETLMQIAKDQKIGGAWISGLGACAWAEAGYYDLDTKKYNFKKLDGPLEILGLQGNVAWHPLDSGNEPVLHIHGTFSDKEMKTYGGHVKELEVAGTCEVLLHRWYEVGLERKMDDETGLNLLNL